MARARTLAFVAISCACTALVMSTVTMLTEGCDTATENNSIDAGLGACNQGPFPFSPAIAQGDTTTPGCSSDDNANLPVVALLPHGTRYPVGEIVNYVGARDPQGDCDLQTVCKCLIPDPSQVPTEVPDAGADADAEAGTPATTTTTPGAPAWSCQ